MQVGELPIAASDGLIHNVMWAATQPGCQRYFNNSMHMGLGQQFQWGPMGSHGNPWEPMGTHGNPWKPDFLMENQFSHGKPIFSWTSIFSWKTDFLLENRFSMDFPLISHGFSMDFPWIFHGFSIDFPWIFHGFSMRIHGGRGSGRQKSSHAKAESPGCLV